MIRPRLVATRALLAAAIAFTGLGPATAAAEVIDLDDEDDAPAKPVKTVKKSTGGAKKSGVIDMDEDDGGGVAAVAGQPSAEMASAKQAFDQKNWPKAASGMYDVVSGATSDDAGNKQLAEFYLAQALYYLKFYQASFDGFAKIAANPKHLKLSSRPTCPSRRTSCPTSESTPISICRPSITRRRRSCTGR
jgi:hypothetical protein